MKQSNSDLFQAIADPSRRQILQLLTKKEAGISMLAENFDMSRPAVSKHVKVLYSAGLIIIKDTGRERICSLRREGFDDLQEWMNFFQSFWDKKLDALGDILASKHKITSKKLSSKK